MPVNWSLGIAMLQLYTLSAACRKAVLLKAVGCLRRRFLAYHAGATLNLNSTGDTTMTPHFTLRRRTLLGTTAALGAMALPALAQSKSVLRISTPAVPDDWHAKMWTVFKDTLERSAPGEFDVQVNLNASLFKQGAEPAAIARGNLELTTVSSFDIAKLVPEFSVFTAGYMVRDPEHQQKVFNGPIGTELFKTVAEKMDVTVLSTCYLGTRQVNLRDVRNVKTPADLKGLKLRMPGSREWLFLGEALGVTATPLAFGEVYLGLKTGTIDGQDNPLPTVRAAKFYEVTKQIVMTSHLVDALFIAIASKAYSALTPAQRQKVSAAAQTAAAYNNENRVKEESQLVEFFRREGLQVTVPDVDAFRKSVQATYQASDYAKVWTKGLVERINATK
jgi:tripartite ATP-independent transporter DctP family solute receptor